MRSAAWARSPRPCARACEDAGRRDRPRGARGRGCHRWRSGGGRPAANPAPRSSLGRWSPTSVPRLLYDRLVDPADLPPEFSRRVAGFKVGSGTFRMNVALSELPDFTCLPRRGRAPQERHHPRADARLHGPRFRRREAARLVAGADRRDADPHHRGRQPGPARRPCRQPVLPAVRAGPARRAFMGRRARGGRRSHHRHGRCTGRPISRPRCSAG